MSNLANAYGNFLSSALPVYQMSRRLTMPGDYRVVAAVGHGEVARATSMIQLTVVD